MGRYGLEINSRITRFPKIVALNPRVRLCAAPTNSHLSCLSSLTRFSIPDAFIELFQLLRIGGAFRKDRSVNILRGVPTGFANDDRIAFLIPI
jgi:hypothetical protein